VIYNLQSKENVVYKRFLEIIGRHDIKPSSLEDIPLLPISVFKSQTIKRGDWEDEALFMSSGTGTGVHRSCHHVKDLDFYNSISSKIFGSFYPNDDYELFALLPSYIENGNSSLVQMSSHLMSLYNYNTHNFFLYNFDDLYVKLKKNPTKKKILIGVTFALVDFANAYKIEDQNLTVVFTGGMKNRKREMSFEEVFTTLKNAFPLSSVDAEYGMTEMFSQSYTLDNIEGNYTEGKTIKIIPKEINDPFKNSKKAKTGQLGFIDLANVDTLSFVLTDDLCVQNTDLSFKLLGRITQSDLRGCTLLYHE
jgi:hypothetical protein